MKLYFNKFSFSVLTLIFCQVSAIANIASELTSLTQNEKKGNIEVNAENFLAGEFIVKLADHNLIRGRANIASIAESLLQPMGGKAQVLFMFTNVFKGFAVQGVPESYVSVLQSDKRVDYITQNSKVQVSATQRYPVWNLDRIDQLNLPLSSSYSYNATGTNVNAYILDTGIMASHSEFKTSTGGTRVTCGFTAFSSEGCSDSHGHGTHVAGTVGGNTYGVAKSVNLITVKVLDKYGDGTLASVIAGIDYVVGQKKNDPTKPMVINMSYGGEVTSLENKAVSVAVRRGIFAVAAAGNDGSDACASSPASAKAAVTVSATDRYDRSTYYSNEGPCTSIFAPGNNVVSASISCPTCSVSLSGTSMAAPHVTGVAALVFQKFPNASPGEIWANIFDAAVQDVVLPKVFSLFPGTPNLLLRSVF